MSTQMPETSAALLLEAAEELDFIRRMSEKQQLDHRFESSYEEHLKDLAFALHCAAKRLDNSDKS